MTIGTWNKLSFSAKMANVGSEVERAMSWREKNNLPYSRLAFERCLELLDLTLGFETQKSRLRELTRLREVLVDYFFGENEYKSSNKLWHNYFFPFNWKYSAQKW